MTADTHISLKNTIPKKCTFLDGLECKAASAKFIPDGVDPIVLIEETNEFIYYCGFNPADITGQADCDGYSKDDPSTTNNKQ